MKKLLLLSLLALFVLPLTSQAEFEIGISANEDGINEFYFAISKHYKTSNEEIVIAQKKKISDDELPVVFFLSKHLGIRSSSIIQLRLDGQSWHQICKFYGLSPEIFYVDLKEKPAPPYGKAWGHFQNKPKRNWREIYLSDEDIINLVNLKFASEYYSCEPGLVIEMRSEGFDFGKIHNAIKDRKNAQKNEVAKAEKKQNKNNGKGKNKSKNK